MGPMAATPFHGLKDKPPIKYRLVIQRQHAAGEDQIQMMAALGPTAQAEVQAAMPFLEPGVARIEFPYAFIGANAQFFNAPI